MKRAFLTLGILCLISAVFAGFRVKNIKPKKPDQFQCRITVAGVTFAADLLLDAKDQKDYFYKELTPFKLIAVRLAIFNNGKDEVVLPLDDLVLLAPDGNGIHVTSPELAAQQVIQGGDVFASSRLEAPRAQAGSGPSDPRSDPSDPRYDPRLDPNSPRYDPNDPRNRGQYPPGTNPPGTNPGSNPTGTYPSGGTLGRPGIVLNPGGGRGEDLTQFERQLAEKDFCDKAHTSDPVLSSTTRDRFLYFPIAAQPLPTKGYSLRVPAGKGIPQEVILKF
jgi:hypothetical protein